MCDGLTYGRSYPEVVTDAPDIRLRQVDAGNVRAICDLRLASGQDTYVAPAATTIAEAHYEPHGWMRAIHYGDLPVGLAYVEVDEDRATAKLVRMMLGADHQGRGYGRRAFGLIVEEMRALDMTQLLVSYVPGPAEPRGFYTGLGFADTGRVEHGEPVLQLRLEAAAEARR